MKNPADYYSKIPGYILGQSNVDALMMYFLMPQQTLERALAGMGFTPEQAREQAQKFMDQQSAALVNAMQTHKKPIVGYSFVTRENSFIRRIQDRGIPVLPTPERAARCLGALVHCTHFRKKLSQT